MACAKKESFLCRIHIHLWNYLSVEAHMLTDDGEYSKIGFLDGLISPEVEDNYCLTEAKVRALDDCSASLDAQRFFHLSLTDTLVELLTQLRIAIKYRE